MHDNNSDDQGRWKDLGGTVQRRTFSGFATKISGKLEANHKSRPRPLQVEKRGRFIIERDGNEEDMTTSVCFDEEKDYHGPADDSFNHPSYHQEQQNFSELGRFILQDRYKQLQRRALGLAGHCDWSHLGESLEEREFPRIEPLVLRPGQARQPAEFPISAQKQIAPIIISNSSGGGTLARRALTSLLPIRRKQPDMAYVLHLVRLAVIDEKELRACLILHVVFGLELPENYHRSHYQGKLPDFRGSLSASHLKKSSNFLILNRIFLLAISRGFEMLLQMLYKAEFPKDPFDSIFCLKGKNSALRKVLPSYFQLAIAFKLTLLFKMMLSKVSPGEVNSTCWLGFTPLLLANLPCNPSKTKASTKITRLLLEAGADPRIGISTFELCNAISSLKRSLAGTFPFPHVKKLYPLDFACATGNCEAVILLLASMQHLGWNLKRHPGILLVQSDLDIIIRLIKAGADVNVHDLNWYTPLHQAARCGKVEILAVLLHAGAKINAKSKSNSTPLHEAAKQGHTAAIRFLISRGADCSVVDDDGCTALQRALQRGIPVEDIIDCFKDEEQMPIDYVDEEQIDELISQMEAFELSSEIDSPIRRQRKSKRRFLIEKIIALPKWLSNMSINNNGRSVDDNNHNNNSSEGICK